MASTYTVKKGDCLWNIAKSQLGNALRWTEIADLNGISRSYPIIHPGQVLKLTSAPVSSDSIKETNKINNSTTATIEYFGLQAGTDTTIYVTWKWDRSNTKEYKIRWWYATKDNVPLLGTESTTQFTNTTYSAPSNAERVWFHVMPISNTYTSNNKEVSYWTAEWSTAKTWYFKDNPPTKPSTPSVNIKDYTLTAELSNLNVNGTSIEFQIVKDNTSVFKTGTAKIITNHASYSCTVSAGSKYKVRCRAVRDTLHSDWSDYSDNLETSPAAPSSIIELRALSETSVHIGWGIVTNAISYDIEYTTKIIYFDSSSEVKKSSVDASVQHAEITGLETGQEYFFRVRAVNEKGSSSWTEIKSVVVGKKPTAPTTWSSTTTVVVGEPLNLYWVHNAVDGSSQTYAELEFTVNGRTEVQTIKNTTDEEEKDKTSCYSIDTSTYTEGVKILWRVRTAGITKQYGDWSVQRTVDVYAPPTLELKLTDVDGADISTLDAFPFFIYGLPGPNTQTPIGYHLTITSDEVYETADSIGNVRTINQGEAVYSKYFDTNDALLVEFSANNVDLTNNISYTVTCTVSMDSGLTCEVSLSLTVAWSERGYTPNAEITIDRDTLAAHIRPYCEDYNLVYYKVVYDSANGVYEKTVELIPETVGFTTVNNDVTTTGEPVYETTDTSGNTLYFCIMTSEVGTLVDGITLSVYRREFDGTFTEIATGLNNISNTFVTDPHPALDYARYRIVAITNATGAVGFYDIPGYPVQEKAAVLQWDEDWSFFDNVAEEPQEKPAWAGSMLKLPYNIDVSDNNNPDVALIEYIGRKHPVSYRGTHQGFTSSWNVEIDKKDVDTLYALRRLQIYEGDVYVREPSGSGYWANVKVSYSQKHLALTIPVTFDITRVEGGI